MKRRKGLLFGLAGILITGNTSADVLAKYNFESGDISNGNVSADPSLSDPRITAGQIVVGDFLDDQSSTSGSPEFGADGFFVRTSDTRNPDKAGDNLLSNALAAGDYISFTLTGANYDISEISYRYETSGSGFLFSSYLFADTSATPFATPTALVAGDALLVTDRSGSSNLATSVTSLIGDNAIVGLEGLNGTTEFRIYVSDGSFETGLFHRIDDIVIKGVPEPSSLALLGLGGICLLRRRRSRTV